jgi:hypothetical protein
MDFGSFKGTVLWAVADEIAPLGGIDVGQAGRHVYRQQCTFADGHALWQRQHQGRGQREGIPQHSFAEAARVAYSPDGSNARDAQKQRAATCIGEGAQCLDQCGIGALGRGKR